MSEQPNIIVPGHETRFRGLSISRGVALAKVCLFNDRRHQSVPEIKVEGEGIQREENRFLEAASAVSRRLERLQKEVRSKLGPAEAEIFAAQKMIVEDQAIHQRVLEEIRKRKTNSEKAVMTALDFFESKISELDNAYLKERASDIGEIKRRLLAALSNNNPQFQCFNVSYCQKGKNRIVVAEELTPTLTMSLDSENTLGFVTERGGPASHAAILARALRIPAVSGIPKILTLLFCGTEILVNGNTGEVIIWPDEKTVASLQDVRTVQRDAIRSVKPIPQLKVMANLNLAKDVDEAVKQEAEGIGLYRTEFELLAEGRLLDEKEHYERYAKVVKAMKGKTVYFRLLDIGGDKTAPFLNLPREDNPYLGFRGARFLLGRPDLFKVQARALARASKFGTVYVMYPMIVGVEQFLKLKQLFEESLGKIPHRDIKHGVMFEVPSACFTAKELFQVADFASIGSNDLIQYLFSVDRNNELVAYDYHPDREVFWKLIRQIVKASKAAKKPLSICGEIAGDPQHIGKLMATGIQTVSVSTRLIPGLRLSVKALNGSDKESI